jgi:hypothetical protein
MNDEAEQLRALLIANRALRRKQVELAERLDRLAEDNDVITCAYAPAVVTGGLSNLAMLWDARLESQILSMHLDRDKPADRAEAAREALIKWRQENAEQADSWMRDYPKEYQLSIDAFSPSGGSPGANPALRQQPSKAISVLTIHNHEYGSGGDGDLTEDRIARLKAIAGRKGWNLRNRDERARAEATMFAEDGRSVETARSFSEALHSYLRAHRLDFTEANRREAALAVAAAREDLVSEMWGASKLVPVSEDISEQAAKFSEVVARERKKLPNWYEESSLAEATQVAARKYQHLIPSQGYGSRGRRSK